MKSRIAAVMSLSLTLICSPTPSAQPPAAGLVPRFARPASGLELARSVSPGAFFDVVGQRAAVFGYEDRPFEVWVYPLKVLEDFTLSFALQGYPLEIGGRDVISGIEVRPEATTFTYSHAAFTVRETVFAPREQPGAIVLLDVQTTLPMRITASFRPRLRPMWPAGLMTPYAGWDAAHQRYTIGEESGRFAAVIGSPGAKDVSLMPYQEEPRDVPLRFVRDISPDEARGSLVPIVITGSVTGRGPAETAYDQMLASVRNLYDADVQFYREMQDRTTDIDVPDAHLVEAFRWAKVGVEKGFATNPDLGTGLVAGFRTSGESERPGFAWFFGRDALWTTLAIDAYGDLGRSRTALEFLRTHQRADGKIPHEISQSAALVPWFSDYPYPWASADATPLFIVAHADYFRTSGDRAFLKREWDAIVRAYKFSAATDTDHNQLIENTRVGHGWVEGGALYPPHEEVYLQGVWIAALQGLSEMADAMEDRQLAAEARAAAERTRQAAEARYWIDARGYYAFATALPKERSVTAEPGPNRDRRQQRLDQLQTATLIDEDTVLPAVPLWWGEFAPERAALEIDHLGSGSLLTDWGSRILSAQSGLYDPLSYHYGSVWPLFTGWTSMAAYRYGRPHVGFQALAANALLTRPGALGYITELLSGDFDAPFGRSSHHQVWSEAMVITPIVRGLFGVDPSAGGRVLSIRPQLPPNWDRAVLRRVRAGGASFDVSLSRGAGGLSLRIDRHGSANTSPGTGPDRIELAPAFPLDARIDSVTVDGRKTAFHIDKSEEVQFARVNVAAPSNTMLIRFVYREGTDVYQPIDPPAPGDVSSGLRVLRSHADGGGLDLLVEGLAGRRYPLYLLTTRRPQPVGADVTGLSVEPGRAGERPRVLITFEGRPGEYVRRTVRVPLSPP